MIEKEMAKGARLLPRFSEWMKSKRKRKKKKEKEKRKRKKKKKKKKRKKRLDNGEEKASQR